MSGPAWRSTRRELLQAVLGLPLAALACRRAPSPRTFPGALLGSDVAAGHRLLQRLPDRFPEPKKIGTVIIGGGIAGLSAGWGLLRAGYDDFVLLELEPRLGGTSASGRSEVTAFPWGAHYVCAPPPENRSLVALLDEVGAVEKIGVDGKVTWAEEVLCQAPQERLFRRGRWMSGLYLGEGASQEDLRQLGAFDKAMNVWAGRRDRRGRRAFALPMAHGSDDPEFTALDRISMAAYMDAQGWRSERLRWWVDYACRDDYGLRLEETSAWAGIFYYASRIPAPGEKPEEFLTWPEGNGRIVNHLQKAVGLRARTGALVMDVIPGDRGVEVRLVDVATGAPEAYLAEHVVCATPAFVTRRLLAPWRAARPAWTDAFRYTPWVVANLGLRRAPGSRGYPLAWDNVLYDSASLGYVDATHQLAAKSERTVWTWYLPLCGPDPLAARRLLYLADRQHWCDAILSDLGRPHPELAEVIESIDVWRWGHAMVRPETGFVWGGAPQAARRAVGRVHFAHTDLSGLALIEEAHFHGVRAAERVVEGGLLGGGRDQR